MMMIIPVRGPPWLLTTTTTLLLTTHSTPLIPSPIHDHPSPITLRTLVYSYIPISLGCTNVHAFPNLHASDFCRQSQKTRGTGGGYIKLTQSPILILISLRVAHRVPHIVHSRSFNPRRRITISSSTTTTTTTTTTASSVLLRRRRSPSLLLLLLLLLLLRRQLRL